MRKTEGRTRKANAVALDRVLVPLSASLGLSSDMRFEKVRKNWPSIVGATNARNLSPVTLKNGVLTVSVSSPAWMTQARFYSSTLLENINAFDPRDGVEVREVRFVLKRL